MSERQHVNSKGALQKTPRTANATEKNKQNAADRAIDDPAKLARAARIVRTALARGRLSLTDLTDGPAS
jgi:hypothetical protein